MSDLGDVFGAMRAAGIRRRARNRSTTPDVLRKHGVKFDEKNGGAHLIVSNCGMVADLWPGTGKYTVRGTGMYRRGVFNLLRDLGFEVRT